MRKLTFAFIAVTIMAATSTLLAQSTYLPLTGGTLSGALTAPSINAVLNPATCGDSTPPSWCSGTDMGQWIEAAYTSLPSSGGELYIPAGSWSYSHSITFNTLHKPVYMHGAGNSATRLVFTGTSGAAITVDTGAQAMSDVLDNFELACSGVATETTGIALGSTTNNGSLFARISLVTITACGTGLNLSWPTSWGFVGDQIQLVDNGQNLVDTVGQENMRISHSLFSIDTPGTTGTTLNSVEISGSTDFSFDDCSFDNVQLTLASNASVKVFGGHFENPSGTSYDFFTTSGLALDFYGVLFQQDATSFANGRFGSASAGRVNLFGGTAYSDVNLPTFVEISGSTSANNYGLLQDSTFSSGWISGSTTSGVTAFPLDNSGDATVSGTMLANYVYSTGNIGAAGFAAWGGGTNISSSSSVAQVGTPVAGHAACIKSSGPPVVIGYCSTQPSSSGTCTCN